MAKNTAASNAVERDKVYVLEPLMVKLTPFLKATLPLPVYDAVSHLLGADTAMAHWTGHEEGPAEATEEPAPTPVDQPEADR